MPSVRITRFAGLLPEVGPRLLREDHAQIAHNTLLWNGYLAALPNWQAVLTAGGTIESLFPAADNVDGYGASVTLESAQLAGMEPLLNRSLWGIDVIDGKVKYYTNYISGFGAPFNIMFQPAFTVNSQSISPQNLSVYPIQRTYAATYLSGNMESAPTTFPVIGDIGNLFEGDIVTLNFSLTNRTADQNITGLRLYHTVVGFDTGEDIQNPRETVFHLTHEFILGPNNNIVYVDNTTSDLIPGDRLLTEQFGNGGPLVDQPLSVMQTESGFLVVVGLDSTFTNRSLIHVSDRFLWHAWPLQNFSGIPEIVTDAVAFYDEIFIGTKQRPYHVRVNLAENPQSDAISVEVRPFPDYYGCVPNTMVTTNFGAMYASADGLVALEVNEDVLTTRKVANPGDVLVNPVTPITLASTVNSVWWNGLYIGFCNGVGYIYVHENSHNSQYPLSQLVTFNPPPGVQGPFVVTGQASGGLFAAFGNVLYRWAMPGYGYESASKQIYHWKSKKFVMAGTTTFAAAKVVNSADGTIQFNFYGDGVLIYSVAVTSSQPFRIPHQHSVIEVELELIGTATIQEVHMATSMRELTEPTGTDYA